MALPEQPLERFFAIGLVGGIASGKSHVAEVFESLGVPRIDADQLAHEVLNRPLVARRLGQVFGEHILLPDKSIDRGRLGQEVFGDGPQAASYRRTLEDLVHPLIHADAIRQLRTLKESDNPPRAVVIDAPLLIEAGWEPLCQAIIFVDTDDEERRRRATARGWTVQQFDSREAAQMPLADKRQHATHVLNGALPADDLRRKIKQILDQIVSPS